MPAQLGELETPALIADRQRIQTNAERMLERSRRFGFALRPHLKTAKSAAIAAIAHGGAKGPVTVSTLREAEYFFANGFGDITYAVCITPNKFRHAVDLIDRGAELKVLLASESVAQSLADFTQGRSTPVNVMIEIDCGDHRTGFAPDADELVAAARRIQAGEGVRLVGLLTHGGQSYGCKSTAEVAAVAEEERTSLIRAQRRLADAGFEAEVLSSGSTPTATMGERFDGLSELRPGVYLAGDLFQAQIGSCAIDDIAISVLASVIAHDPARNSLVVDAGALALSKDRSTRASPVDYGYGLLIQADGRPFRIDMIIAGVSQEHGQVTSREPLPYDALPIGANVRVLPNHACMTAASYHKYYVTDGVGTEIVAEWDKVSGW